MDKRKLEELLELAEIGLSKEYVDIPLDNPFDKRTRYDIENPHIFLLKLLKNPNYFPFTCKNLFNITLAPFQAVILRELWIRKYPMLIASRGSSKTFLLAVYCLLRALFNQGSKIVLVGGAFRQAKAIFEYAETIWNNAPVLRSMVDINDRKQRPSRDIDRVIMKIGLSTITGIPIGTGEKIRGLRASHLIVDEFNSVPEDIYETVVAGFAAVQADPVKKMQQTAREKLLKELNLWSPDTEDDTDFGNQSVIAGTAGYDFQHFSKYWKRYKSIIDSKGDHHKLLEIFNGKVPPKFNWKNYSVIRIPYTLLPENFMDEEHIARSRATVHTGIFDMEYNATFISDSAGFFKRTLLESCVCPINHMIHGRINFTAGLSGNKNEKFVFGIDPASEQDNFSIVILQLMGDHRRIVYTWSTNRKAYKQILKEGLSEDTDYYSFCARKIRELLQRFPSDAVAIDSQGGGITVEESLHDVSRIKPGEQLIWKVIDPDKPQDSDNYAGLHILYMINFAKAEWVSEANHGLKKDFEDKALLFPHFDPLSLEFAIQEDKVLNRTHDTLEDCVMEIEELKNELVSIVHTPVGVSQRERWDTPEIRIPGSKKGRLRKDRYSALLMANMIARNLQRPAPQIEYVPVVGGFAHMIDPKNTKGEMYVGGNMSKNLKYADYYTCVKRNV